MSDAKIYKGLSYAEYEALDGIRQSELNRLANSPAHLRWYLEHRSENVDSDAFRIGSAVDSKILTPSEFDRDYVCGPDVDRRYKDGKEIWNTFVAENAGKTILKASEWEEVHAMAFSMSQTNCAKTLIDEAETQLSITWTDEKTEIPCKARLDGFCRDLGLAFDLKTTRDIRRFRWSIVDFGYARQAAWYLRALKSVGFTPEHFLFVVIDKEPPYCVMVYRLLEDVITVGENSIDSLLATYRKCLDSNTWPGYPDCVQDICLTNLQIEKIMEA